MILIALGANLPFRGMPPEKTLKAALDALAAEAVRVLAVSSLYETPAWPDPSDPPFVNAVVRIATALPPDALMQLLHGVEARFGRVRSAPNAPRTLDLDLLDYDGRVEEGPPILPHPRLASRAFVLVPLAEIAPQWRHPVSGERATTLLAALGPEAEKIGRIS